MICCSNEDFRQARGRRHNLVIGALFPRREMSSRHSQDLFLRLLVILCALTLARASPSCCKKHLLPLIPDPEVDPPDIYEGQTRRIPDDDPANVRPEGWDDEDDGDWQPMTIANPLFSWISPLVHNPAYRPPSFFKGVREEISKAVPWVVFGTLATALMQASGMLSLGALGLRMRRAGPFQGSLLGLATPLCSCGSLPVAAGLLAGGAPLGAVVSFLTAAQSSGLDSAAVTWGLLGPTAALCRIGGAVALAVAAGLAVPLGGAPSAGSGTGRTGASKGGTSSSPASVVAVFFDAAVSTAHDVFPPVLVGVFLSSAALWAAPHLASAYQALQALWGVDLAVGSGLWSGQVMGAARSLLLRLVMLVAVLPLQLCEHTTVAYAAAIQKAGAAPGLAFAFLLVAPATNLPTLLLLLRAGGHGQAAARRVAAVLVFVALALSYAVDFLEIDLLVVKEADESDSAMPSLPEWYVTSSPWIAVLLLIGVGNKIRLNLNGKSSASNGTEDNCCAGDDKISSKIKPKLA